MSLSDLRAPSPWSKAWAFDATLTPYGEESDAKQVPPAWAFDFQEQRQSGRFRN